VKPQDIPQYLEKLKRDHFYGDIRLCVKRGEVVRLIVEQSILMGETRNERHDDDNK
jgi:hypothetical protein